MKEKYIMKEGDKLPNVVFKVRSMGAWFNRTTKQFFKGKRVILFSLPGAFTPICSNVACISLADLKVKCSSGFNRLMKGKLKLPGICPTFLVGRGSVSKPQKRPSLRASMT